MNSTLVMCTDFGDRRSRDRELAHKKKHKQTAIFGLKIY